MGDELMVGWLIGGFGEVRVDVLVDCLEDRLFDGSVGKLVDRMVLWVG